MDEDVELRVIDRSELARVAEIDRSERIDVLYEQRGTELVARHGEWSAHAWDPGGEGEHSVGAQVRALEGYLDAGGTVIGAFEGDRLVGIGAVVPELRPSIAQLAYLHVTASARSRGVGRSLAERLEEVARSAGASEMVVSATPSENTVRFYMGRGFRPTSEPLPELVALEPDDVHLRRPL